jgi:hypothetical protein
MPSQIPQKEQNLHTLGQRRCHYVRRGGEIWLLNKDLESDTGRRAVTISEITNEEYDSIKELLAKDEAVEDESDNEDSEPDGDIKDDSTLEWIVSKKIAALSRECSSAIANGVDVTLQDGKTYHFSLTLNDQFNITRLAARAREGDTRFIWHPDGGDSAYYSANEILKIEQAMESLITYHTTYYNSLKRYVQSLATVKDIDDVWYGMEIPEAYISAALKGIIEKN